MLHYSDYYWKKGIPQGIKALKNDPAELRGRSYRIVTDPYFIRYSIEIYDDGIFQGMAYDSALLDFRNLSPAQQAPWRREELRSEGDRESALIYDQNDRIILKEVYRFEEGLCRECLAYSPHGILVSIQKIYYQKFQDAFDGVILLDTNMHCVVIKHYEADEEGLFLELIDEVWDMGEVAAGAT